MGEVQIWISTELQFWVGDFFMLDRPRVTPTSVSVPPLFPCDLQQLGSRVTSYSAPVSLQHSVWGKDKPKPQKELLSPLGWLRTSVHPCEAQA